MHCPNPISVKGDFFPCAKCLTCRINKRRIWTARMMIESLVHEHLCFVTLTYRPEDMPLDSVTFTHETLRRDDFTKFMKRFREDVRLKYGRRLRFFGVGEYGDRSGRPHYHAILYGWPTCLYGSSRYSRVVTNCCVHCDFVRDAWGLGNVRLDPFIRERAQYCAHYTVKKMTSKDDSRLIGREPEFPAMSRMPGIGAPAISMFTALIREHGARARDDLLDVPSFCKSGGSSIAFGRYLRQKMREDLGDEQSEVVKLEREKALKVRFMQELARFLEEGGSISEFFDRKERVKVQAALNLDARHRINLSRRKI